MIEISKKRDKAAKKAHLSPADMAFADLVVAGWSEWDAFIAVGMYNVVLSDERNKAFFAVKTENKDYIMYVNERRNEMEARQREMSRAEKKMKAYLDSAKDKADKAMAESDNADTPMSKEELLRELKDAADRVKLDDPKAYAQIMGKYADLQKMKQDDVKTDDTTVHYYLPLTCSKCSLYAKAKKERLKARQADSEEMAG